MSCSNQYSRTSFSSKIDLALELEDDCDDELEGEVSLGANAIVQGVKSILER